MDRKKFLVTSALTAVGLTTFGKVLGNSVQGFKGDCETTNDILGPYYRENSPSRSDLTYKGLEGSKIILKGKVYESDCKTEIKNAKVEIWHCNSKGEYDNDSDEFRQRGQVSTDENGEYMFTTIFPGKYLNGKLYRPAHIHFRVNAENQKELISQIYFQGDPHIAKDYWASDSKAEARILSINPIDVSGNLEIRFDIFLSEK